MSPIKEKPISPLLSYDTYVYIDVSNIRLACQKTLGFRIDFVKLMDYFQRKYPNLKEVRYYEGVAKGDLEKQNMFKYLQGRGYTICALERKSYNSTNLDEHEVKCPECDHEWTESFAKERKTMKSNVDVYLASDMIVQASTAERPMRIILVSCDGDYAEAIKNAIHLNDHVLIAVLATPLVQKMARNTLSTRFRDLAAEIPTPRYILQNIKDIRDNIVGE